MALLVLTVMAAEGGKADKQGDDAKYRRTTVRDSFVSLSQRFTERICTQLEELNT